MRRGWMGCWAVLALLVGMLGMDVRAVQAERVNAKGAVVLDALTGRVLFAQEAHLRLPMASTTKMMSALLTLEEENLDEWFTVDAQAIRVEGSSMGLREGDRVTLSALAAGMLLPSGNDAAAAAAVRIAGSEAAFAERMNERAAELGMVNSHFVTASGLDAPAHYSSAYDLALLAREALANRHFAEICAQQTRVVQFGNPPYNRWLKNHNRLLRSYEGTVGVKTGFTDSAGRCLVSSVRRGGVGLIVVTLGCPDDWNTHMRLYDRFFAALTPTDPTALIPPLEAVVAGGAAQTVPLTYDPPPPIALREGERLTARVLMQPMLFAPVGRGALAGSVLLECEGQTLLELPLTTAQAVNPQEPKENGLTALFERLRGL